MENQHRKIKGYRELSQEEIDLMNEVKAQAEATKKIFEKIQRLRSEQDAAESEDISFEQMCESRRCSNIAQTNLQQGFMWLTRAVALPDSF